MSGMCHHGVRLDAACLLCNFSQQLAASYDPRAAELATLREQLAVEVALRAAESSEATAILTRTRNSLIEETNAAAARADRAEALAAERLEVLRDLLCAWDTDGTCTVPGHDQPCGCEGDSARATARRALASPDSAKEGGHGG